MDALGNFTVSDLSELLRNRGLPVSYRLKSDLVDTLRSAISKDTVSEADLQSEVFQEETKQTDGGDSEDQQGHNSERNGGSGSYDNDAFQNETKQPNGNSEQKTQQTEGKSPHDSGQNDQYQGGSDNHDETIREEKSTSFHTRVKRRNVQRRVEDALTKFGGEPHDKIEEWFEEFELTATSSDVQKHLFARKLLTGDTRKNVQSAKGISSYDTFKA